MVIRFLIVNFILFIKISNKTLNLSFSLKFQWLDLITFLLFSHDLKAIKNW